MIIAIPKEVLSYETRVASTPETVKKYIKMGFEVKVETNAGLLAGFSDNDYQQAGAKIYSTAQQTYKNANFIIKINAPQPSEYKFLSSNMTIIADFKTAYSRSHIKDFAQLGTQCFALELIPRISRAQPMDILSSQNNLAGYRAIIEAISHSPYAVPLMMTAAGTIPPIKILVLGVGVAGLQAIATAQRLGAQVYASDIRPETQEQVESLGAQFIPTLSQEVLKKINIIITCALIKGHKSPILINDSQLQMLPPHTIIIDMATDYGGNIEGSHPNQTIEKYGVKIIGNSHLATLVATSASQLFSNNIYNFLIASYNPQNKQIYFNFQDELINQTCICKNGEIL